MVNNPFRDIFNLYFEPISQGTIKYQFYPLFFWYFSEESVCPPGYVLGGSNMCPGTGHCCGTGWSSTCDWTCAYDKCVDVGRWIEVDNNLHPYTCEVGKNIMN